MSGKQKQVGNNDFIKDVARRAASWGLPSRFLFPVAEQFELNVLDKNDDSNDRVSFFELGYAVLHKKFNLHQSVIDEVRRAEPGIDPFDPDPLGTIYHEGTHAYMLLKQSEQPVRSLQIQGTEYYTNAPLAGGGVVDDPLRAFREAGGEYVEDHAFGCLIALHKIKSHIKSRKFTADEFAAIRKDYNKMMQKSLTAGSWGDNVNALTIPPALKQYLDKEILEDKIPAFFDDCKLLRDVLTQGGFGILLKTVR